MFAARRLQILQQEEALIVIERGDVLWVDYGLTAMRLATDTQDMGYVLKEGEAGPPAGIVNALENSKKMQGIVMKRMAVGRTGSEVLAEPLKEVPELGIKGKVYSHLLVVETMGRALGH